MTPTTPALPGLSTLGKKTAEDAAKAGIPQITVKHDLPAGGWVAFDHLPEGVSKEQVLADAEALAMNPDLNQLSFLEYVKGYEIDATPTIDGMLASVKARNAGEAGKRVVMITSRCRDLGKKVPQPNPKFVAKFRAGQATASDILWTVKWLGKEIEKFRLSFEDMLTLVEKEETYHTEQSQLSFEACARDLQIAKEEDEREDRLIIVTATLEKLEEFLQKRLAGELSEDDRTRLTNVEVLVMARIKNLRPMCQKANLASKRFAIQANSNALTSLDQWDFATAGLASWKSDIAGQLDAVANIAMNMAYLEGVRFTDEQARATADAFDEQMQSMAQVMATQLQSVETIQYVTDSLVRGMDVMAKAFDAAKTQDAEAARVIQGSKEDIAAAQQQFSSSIVATLRKQGVGKAEAQAAAALTPAA